MSAALQQSYERFAGQFLRPLLAGGTVRVARPVAPGALPHFEHARPADADADAALFDALHARASEVAPIEALPFPERDTMAMAIACHDLLVLTDPSLDRAWARRARPVVLGWVQELIDAIQPPSSRGRALARHAVLGRVLALRRRDVTVRNWAYTYRFFGRPVPPRVVSLPKLRRVKTEERTRGVLSLWDELDVEHELAVRPCLRALLSRSPVTELLRIDLATDLRLGGASSAVLGDARLRHGIARSLVGRGLGDVASPLGHALRTLAEDEAPPQALQRVLLLCWEVHTMDALDLRDAGELPRSRSPDAELFLAVLPALLDAPPGPLASHLVLTEVDRARVTDRARALQGMLAPEPLRWVGWLLGRAGWSEPATAPPVEAHP